MSAITVQDLCFSYEARAEAPIFSGLSFEVPRGSFFSILGPSGGGKSTLLRLIAGLLRPSSGSILCDGRPVVGPSRERGIVFQQGGLFPWLTALGNVAFSVSKTHRGMSRAECRAFAADMLGRVGLSADLHKWPAQLSGGMRQRVAIARALAMETDILLMDEPFSALDYRNRCLLQDLLAELWLSTGKTVIFVTHDIDEAMLLSSRILFIDGVRAFPSVPMESPQPRPRSVLTTPEFCGIRKHFINLFNGGELFGVPAL
jgi:ABC-type nitrate/sulfonate/bicarbonate transport system ATPase subunit